MRRVSDPEFTPPFVNPFPVGTSPFRQKGNAFRGDLAYFDTCVPGGSAAVLKAVTDPATRAFLAQKFVSSEWYDAFPNVQMQQIAARLRGLTFEEHRRRTGAFHAEEMNGLYRALLRIVSNESVATWVPRINALYWNFGKTETKIAGPNEVRGVRRGTPKGLLQWLAWASIGFSEATLRLAGARNPVTVFDDVEIDGKEAGQETCSVRVRITWA